MNRVALAKARRSLYGGLVIVVTAGLNPAEAQDSPQQEIHRASFSPASDEVFAVVTQFYEFDRALPLDVRTIERWEDRGRRFETVVFSTSTGERVPGDLVLPSGGQGPYPAVLMVHGLGSNRDRWWEPDRVSLPNSLLDNGIAVLSIDLRLHGARSVANDYQNPVYLTMGNELFVRSRDMTIQSAIDCRRALDVLGERTEIDASKLAVAGYSMGAMIGLYLSALEPELVAVVAAAVPTREQTLPSDPFNFAVRARMPVLLQIGRTDWLSSPEDARRLRDLVPDERGHLRFYDAGHRLPPEFAGHAAEWLAERLTSQPAG